MSLGFWGWGEAGREVVGCWVGREELSVSKWGGGGPLVPSIQCRIGCIVVSSAGFDKMKWRKAYFSFLV